MLLRNWDWDWGWGEVWVWEGSMRGSIGRAGKV